MGKKDSDNKRESEKTDLKEIVISPTIGNFMLIAGIIVGLIGFGFGISNFVLDGRFARIEERLVKLDDIEIKLDSYIREFDYLRGQIDGKDLLSGDSIRFIDSLGWKVPLQFTSRQFSSPQSFESFTRMFQTEEGFLIIGSNKNKGEIILTDGEGNVIEHKRTSWPFNKQKIDILFRENSEKRQEMVSDELLDKYSKLEDYFSNNDAMKGNFDSLLLELDILHIATHGTLEEIDDWKLIDSADNEIKFIDYLLYSIDKKNKTISEFELRDIMTKNHLMLSLILNFFLLGMVAWIVYKYKKAINMPH